MQKSDEVNRKLEDSAEKIAAFSKKESAIVDALEETEKALDKARKQVTRLTQELLILDDQITDLENNYHELEEQADIMEKYVAKRLAALYKLSWLGKFQVLASADSMVDFFFSQALPGADFES